MAHLNIWDDHEQKNYKVKKVFYKKLVVVGDGGVGKTSLLVSFAEDTFSDNPDPTIFDTYAADIKRNISGNKKNVQLRLWDTAGQEDYAYLRPLSYPDTDIILMCFCVDDEASLINVVQVWLPEIKKYCPKVPFILVGLKNDLRDEPCKSCNKPTHTDNKQVHDNAVNLNISTEFLREKTIAFGDTCKCLFPDKPKCLKTEDGVFSKEKIGAAAYIECSAKTREGIKEVFEMATEVACSKRKSSFPNICTLFKCHRKSYTLE